MTKYLKAFDMTVSSDGTLLGTYQGYMGNRGYRVVCTQQGNIFLHRLIALAFIGPRPKGCHIDHIDGNKKNNSVFNLEYITPRENVIRDKTRKNGGVKGYSVNDSGTFTAKIRYNGRYVYLGTYFKKEDASAAYRRAAETVDHGEVPLSPPRRWTRRYERLRKKELPE